MLSNEVNHSLGWIPPCPAVSLTDQRDKSQVVGITAVQGGVVGTRRTVVLFLIFILKNVATWVLRGLAMLVQIHARSHREVESARFASRASREPDISRAAIAIPAILDADAVLPWTTWKEAPLLLFRVKVGKVAVLE